MASTSTGIPNGSSPAPIADRAWRPASPQISRIKSLKPLMAAGVTLNPSAHLTKPSALIHRPTRSRVPSSCCREARIETGRAGRVVGLLNGDLATDAARYKQPVAVEWSVARHVREAVVHSYHFERQVHPGRGRRGCRQLDPKFGEAVVDRSHTGSLSLKPLRLAPLLARRAMNHCGSVGLRLVSRFTTPSWRLTMHPTVPFIRTPGSVIASALVS